MVHEIPKSEVYLQRVEFFPLDTEGTVNITVVVQSGSNASEVCLNFTFDGQAGAPVCVAVHSLFGKIGHYNLPCKATSSCKVWSFDDPNLTEVVVTSQHSQDAIHTRFGLRTITRTAGKDSTRLAVNGCVITILI